MNSGSLARCFVCNSWPRREHSREPQEFYDLIRRVTDEPRIDIFSRELREGFKQCGNEVVGQFEISASRNLA